MLDILFFLILRFNLGIFLKWRSPLFILEIIFHHIQFIWKLEFLIGKLFFVTHLELNVTVDFVTWS
jgi:hypothetical protein